MPASRALSSSKQTHLTYHVAALTHWSALLPVGAGVAAALATWSVWLAATAFVLGDLLLIGILPRVTAFRRSIDVRFERLAAGKERVRVLGHMMSVHRDELERLERLSSAVRERCGGARPNEAPAGAQDPSVERWLGLEKLVAMYAEIAVTYRCNAMAFRPEDQANMDAELLYVEGLARLRHGRSDAWIDRRRAIVRRRQETWARAAEERDLMVHSLATIGGVIRWMHELCTVAMGDAARLAVEEVLASWESNAATLREVSSLRRADLPPIDPRAFALGRDVVAKDAQRALRLGEPTVSSDPRGTAPDSLAAPATVPLRHIGFQPPPLQE